MNPDPQARAGRALDPYSNLWLLTFERGLKGLLDIADRSKHGVIFEIGKNLLLSFYYLFMIFHLIFIYCMSRK